MTDEEIPHAIARCVVLRQTAGVSRLLATAPFSADEVDRIRALQGDFSLCISPGVRFAVSRQALRGLLAEAALHYAQALRDGWSAAPRR